MNNDGATVLSRKNRFDEPKEEKNPKKESNHGGLLVLLVFVSLFLLASAPVYGMVKNQPKLSKSTTTSSKSTSKQSSKSQSSVTTDSTQESSDASSAAEASSAAAASSSEAAASSANEAATASANANTAVLGTGQTLYNFAITHNTSPANIIALNPGVTTTNYSQYAGQALRIK